MTDENTERNLTFEVNKLKLKVHGIETNVVEAKDQIKTQQVAFTALSGLVTEHIGRNEERDERLSKDVRQLTKGLNTHMAEEMTHHEGRAVFEGKMLSNFDRVYAVVADMEKKVVSNGFKTKVMWAIMIGLGTALLGLVFGVAQSITEDKVKKYTEEDKRTYYEKRVVETDAYKKMLASKGVTVKE